MNTGRPTHPPEVPRSPHVLLPNVPCVVVGHTHAGWLAPDGEIEDVAVAEAARRLRTGTGPPIVCHMPETARRLGLDPFRSCDVLELFAFVRPARHCVPTPKGLAAALGLDAPRDPGEAALALYKAAQLLLGELARRNDTHALPVAAAMARGGWAWGPSVLAALATEAEGPPARGPTSGLDVWNRLPEWEEEAPRPPPGDTPVQPQEARQRLNDLLPPNAELRPAQGDYASAVTAAFERRQQADAPHFIMAEAGTGVGKTLGYIAPASRWAETNEAPVWISTYTRNLQHQIDRELDRLYPDPAMKASHVVIRKGRENYLCLLNFADAARAVGMRPEDAVALGLVARWALATRSGDMNGGDFPAWLPDLAGRGRLAALADQRGECVYSACAHYRQCFIERNIRAAQHADLVVANHALVMIHAARGGDGAMRRPTRYVFDEGHHVFDAADNAFSAHLSGLEAAELRRWLRGAETRRTGRSRGLQQRLEGLGDSDAEIPEAMEAALRAAGALPGPGWHQRCAEGAPTGPAEAFLAQVRAHVHARAENARSPYGLEASAEAPDDALRAAAAELDAALGRLAQPLAALRDRLQDRLDEAAEDLDTRTRNRIEALARSIDHRGVQTLRAWRFMLAAIGAETPADFVDWFDVARIDGRDVDVGMRRHWIDPTIPFVEHVAAPAHGVVITSATLTDGSGDTAADWATAEARTGANHLGVPALRAAVPSPFDYAAQTRVFIVRDVRKDDLAQVAAAYRELFLAAGGGALGIFTAIARLRAVHGRIAPALEGAGIPLYAQHVDGLNLPTLIDIFRAEEDACLLGTDAVRDGVDVPGRALRLIVFDRVPWARPTILHRARRKTFGGRAFDDATARLRLKQAYGRLVRQADDQGAFVLLDPMMPSRLLGAFPDGVSVIRCGLAEAVAGVRALLRPSP